MALGRIREKRSVRANASIDPIDRGDDPDGGPCFAAGYFSLKPASFTSREFPPTNTLKAPASASHLPAAV